MCQCGTTVVVDLAPIAMQLAELKELLMSSFADLAAASAAEHADVTRILALLLELKATIAEGVLTAEQQAILDAAVATAQGDSAAIDAEAPEPAPAPEVPAEPVPEVPAEVPVTETEPAPEG